MTDKIKFLKDAIKYKINGQEVRTRVGYHKYDGDKGKITIYARDYKHLPGELNPVNNSDSQTDYFENDKVEVYPKNKYYQKVLKAMEGKEKSRKLREIKSANKVIEHDEILMGKVKKLSEVMETNQLLDFELSGYLRDKDRRDIFARMAKHNLQPRKKYISINRENSGKFLVETNGPNKGMVFHHKAYGQRGYLAGDIDKVIKQFEKGNESLGQAVMDRAMKKYMNKINRLALN